MKNLTSQTVFNTNLMTLLDSGLLFWATMYC